MCLKVFYIGFFSRITQVAIFIKFYKQKAVPDWKKHAFYYKSTFLKIE